MACMHAIAAEASFFKVRFQRSERLRMRKRFLWRTRRMALLEKGRASKRDRCRTQRPKRFRKWSQPDKFSPPSDCGDPLDVLRTRFPRANETYASGLVSRREVIFPEAEKITWACLVGGPVAVRRGRRRSHR